MDISLWILVVLVLAMAGVALGKGGWQLLVSGLTRTGKTLKFMWFRLLLGFTLGGLIQVLIPSPVIAEWLGPASGLKGILIGAYAGILMPGGPHIVLPVLASILAAGAGPAPVMALLASSNLISLNGLFTWQIPFLGVKLSVARYVIGLFIPPLVGLGGAGVYHLLSAS